MICVGAWRPTDDEYSYLSSLTIITLANFSCVLYWALPRRLPLAKRSTEDRFNGGFPTVGKSGKLSVKASLALLDIDIGYFLLQTDTIISSLINYVFPHTTRDRSLYYSGCHASTGLDPKLCQSWDSRTCHYSSLGGDDGNGYVFHSGTAVRECKKAHLGWL